MPAATVRERLASLGAAPAAPPSVEPLELPRGFEYTATPYGPAVVREDVIPLPALDPHPGNVAYLDTETTGLAGGTGTYVFAAAVARPIDCGLRTAQFFLPRPGMESGFLDALRHELADASALASFNGAAFDLPILRTRWVMARLPGDLEHPPHSDLLTLVRSLYRHRLEGCDLRHVEERLLGYEREDPLPSHLAPDAYFSFVRFGETVHLEAALEHNRLDVISLVHVHSKLLRRLHGDEPGMDAADWLALGRHRIRRGARADGWRAMRNATAFGRGEAAATAALVLARGMTRRGLSVSAEALLAWLESGVTDDIRLSVARARLLEWKRRDPAGALAVIEAALERMPDTAAELEGRLARLKRKLVRAPARSREGRAQRPTQLEAPLDPAPGPPGPRGAEKPA